ncbi:hypothetical protein ACFYOV_15045 [Streptomyces sp. NPDC005931]|uniref:hypothetical protein n=1 Tax=Streptomyces sp. NPDC005931 TaxID=3364737 RepID=UPI00368119A7
MRLCTPLPLCLAAAATLVSVPFPAHATGNGAQRPRPTCAAPDGRSFPLATRIHGGPGSYEAGGGYGTWYLDLKNTTGRVCEDVHPVVVLVDRERALRPSQPTLEFFAGSTPHPVRFERTDRDELVGPFDDGFPGFTVGPHRTLTVKLRLAITSDAVANEVTATAAVVQRRASDGDWVGQSDDYRFRIDAATAHRPRPDTPGTAQPPGTGAPTDQSATPPPPAPETASPLPTAPGTAPPGRPLPGQLAGTGFRPLHAALTAAAVLVTAAGVLLLARGRR